MKLLLVQSYYVLNDGGFLNVKTLHFYCLESLSVSGMQKAKCLPRLIKDQKVIC